MSEPYYSQRARSVCVSLSAFFIDHVSVLAIAALSAKPRAGSGVVRMDPLRFLAGCRTRRLNQA